MRELPNSFPRGRFRLQLMLAAVVVGACSFYFTSVPGADSGNISSTSTTSCDDWKPINGTAYLIQAEWHQKRNPKMCGNDSRYKCPAEQLGYGRLAHCSKQALLLDDPEALLSQLSGQTIGFFGDSMVRQTFSSFMCQLGDDQCENVYTGNKGLHVAVHCPRHNVTFAQAWFQLTPGEKFWKWEEGYLNADTIVFGIGAFATSEMELRNAVELLYTKFSRHGQRQLIWQEYSATHFPTNSSDYEFDAFGEFGAQHRTNYACTPHSSPEAFLKSAMAYRLEAPLEILKDRKDIEILHEFSSSVPRWEQHSFFISPDEYYYLDCRHFCQPSPVLDLRTEKLAQLLRVLRLNTLVHPQYS